MRRIFIILYALLGVTLSAALTVRFTSDTENLQHAANVAQVLSISFLVLSGLFQSVSWLVKRNRFDAEVVEELERAILSLSPLSSFSATVRSKEDLWPVPWRRTSTRPSTIGINGTAPELAASVADGPTRPLVLLGAGGSGKTELIDLAIFEASRSTAERRPILVRLQMGSFAPNEARLFDWMSREILAIAARSGISLNSSRVNLIKFVSSGRLLPVLDGLDEMLPESRPEALRALAESGLRSFILVSRGEEFRHDQANLAVAHDCVELDSLPQANAIEILVSHCTGGSWNHWVGSAVTMAPVIEAISRPLYLGLLSNLADQHADVPDLAGVENADQMASLIIAAYLDHVSARGIRAPIGSARGPAIRVRHLRTIAESTAVGDHENFLWWNLSSLLPWWLVVLEVWFASAAVAGIGTWIGAKIDQSFFGSPSVVSALGFAGFTAVIAAGSLSIQNPAVKNGRLFGRITALGAFVTAVVYLFGTPPTGPMLKYFAGGIFLVILTALCCGLLGWEVAIGVKWARSLKVETWPRPVRAIIRPIGFLRTGAPRSVAWNFKRQTLALAIVVGLVNSALVISMYFSSLSTSTPLPVANPLLGSVTAGAVSILAFFVPASFGRTKTRRLTITTLVDNLAFGFIRGGLVASGLVVWEVVLALSLDQGLASGFSEIAKGAPVPRWLVLPVLLLALFVITSVGFGFLSLVLTSAARFGFAWLVLAITGRLPLRTLRMLADSTDVGLLHFSGSVYRIRHSSVREALLRMDAT